MRSTALAGLCAAAVALSAPRVARAETSLSDYDPYSDAWNGMSVFKALAEGAGLSFDVRTQLEWGELTAADILFVAYPLAKVEPSKLSAFLQAGGHAVIADDFGDGHDALAALGLLRAEVVTPRATRYQDGRVWAPIATRRSEHEVGREVDEVVTNHPAALTQVEGATTVIGFADSAVVVAGERGTGRFVAVSDPSVFINRMLQYPGNVQLATNILRWLRRGGRARNLVFVRGEVSMFGVPAAFIDDPRGGKAGRAVADVNVWLASRRDWLLTPGAMKGLAAALAASLLALALLALPVARGPRNDGRWLRIGRPGRRDEPHALVATADGRPGSFLVLSCILRDQVQALLADALAQRDPLFTMSEPQLARQLAAARGGDAAAALARVYRRLRALPSRGQAAAPWSNGQLTRRDFDSLHKDVATLCRTLGAPLDGSTSNQPAA